MPRENVTCLDDAYVMLLTQAPPGWHGDGMGRRLRRPAYCRSLGCAERRCSTSFNLTQILTFDAHGVSGHPNHMAVHVGARRVQALAKIPRLDILSLDTRSVASKYTGIAAATWDRLWPQRGLQTLAHPFQYERSLAAMREHASQLVWFRYLYVLFSSYMHVNAVSIDHT